MTREEKGRGYFMQPQWQFKMIAVVRSSGDLTEFKKNFLCTHCTCKMGALTIDINFFKRWHEKLLLSYFPLLLNTPVTTKYYLLVIYV